MSFPDVSDAFSGWTATVKLRTTTQTVVDYQSTEVAGSDVVFDGVLEPLSPQQLLVKPEGERAWKWWNLWTKTKLDLGQVIVDPESKEYRVMKVSDWRDGGHLQYELIQDPPLAA